MDEVKRVIACTEKNAAQMREVVMQWPQLHELVKGLKAQGRFPGLRGMTVTLTGTPAFVGKGLDALTGDGGMLAAAHPAKGGGDAH